MATRSQSTYDEDYEDEDTEELEPESQSGFAILVPARLVGLLSLAFVTFALLSLASWSVDDPSLSFATDKAPANWLGYPGAVVADLGFQLFGLGALLVLVPPAFWAFGLVLRRMPPRFGMRVLTWIGGSIAGAGLLSCFAIPSSWPLPTGLGGLVGAGFTALAILVTGHEPGGGEAIIYALILLPPTLALLWVATGLSVRDANLSELDPDAEIPYRTGITDVVFGGIAHGLLRMGTAWQRAWSRSRKRAEKADAEWARAMKKARAEAVAETSTEMQTLDRRNARIVDPFRDERREPVLTLPEPVLADEDDEEQSYEDEEEEDFDTESDDDDEDSDDDEEYEDADDSGDEEDDEEEYEDEDGEEYEDDEDAEYDEDEEELDEEEYDEEEGDDEEYEDEDAEDGEDEEFDEDEEELDDEDDQEEDTDEEKEDEPSMDDNSARMSVERGRAAAKPQRKEPVKQPVKARQKRRAAIAEPEEFELPDLELLAAPKHKGLAPEHRPEKLEANARRLEGVLDDFGVKGDIVNVRPGPVVTLYELEPAPGIKSSRVISLADDIARSMSAISARVAVVPGRNAIGIELPNHNRETVYLREMLDSSDFDKTKGKLNICLGKTIGGEPIVADLARMPHLLVAGTTGSGKSVAINTMILSLLYKMTPEQCRLIMIDPKMLELSIYDGIPHLLTPVVTDPSKAVVALKWAVREMEDRYRKMSKIGVRNIDGFNQRVSEANRKGKTISRTVQTGFDKETGEAIYESEEFDLQPLPFIVVIVDEMADLMMVAGKDIEGAIQRLAQMARAAGIHLIMATQRPSVDVITGTIKANFPTRISFQVTSKIDSRTILGEQGAEQLLGMGDMLYMAGGGRIRRLHGPFVSDREVEEVVSHLKSQGTPDYLESITEEDENEGGMGGAEFGGSGDELYDKAVNIVLQDRKASTSYIQRRLSIGYNRAATLIERMEQEGVISPANHAGKREILVGDGADY